MILIPHSALEDKHKGTAIITSILKNDKRIKPERVLIDHCEEHTISRRREQRFGWADDLSGDEGDAAARRDILEQFGPQMICVNSAADWANRGQ